MQCAVMCVCVSHKLPDLFAPTVSDFLLHSAGTARTQGREGKLWYEFWHVHAMSGCIAPLNLVTHTSGNAGDHPRCSNVCIHHMRQIGGLSPSHVRALRRMLDDIQMFSRSVNLCPASDVRVSKCWQRKPTMWSLMPTLLGNFVFV